AHARRRLTARRAERTRRFGLRLHRAERRRRRLASAQNQRRTRTSGGPRGRRRPFFVEDRPQPPEIPNDLFVDAFLHRLEETEAFLLVFDERIALAVPAQADAFLQMVEAVEVILPLLID